jgi:hypothetical protein
MGPWTEGAELVFGSKVDQVCVPLRGSNLSRWLRSNDQDKTSEAVAVASPEDTELSATAH